MHQINGEQIDDGASITWVTHDSVRPGGDESVVFMDAEFESKVFAQLAVTPCADGGADHS